MINGSIAGVPGVYQPIDKTLPVNCMRLPLIYVVETCGRIAWVKHCIGNSSKEQSCSINKNGMFE